ncbi:MAG: hypothetical protein QNJ77_07415 [Acidimicrobiia bacterium]|nr:hypothetical protein [Acidimicrobiia bacterium]
MTTCPLPRHPRRIVARDQTPTPAQLESARLLAKEARPFLTGCGFSDKLVLEWALSYVAEEESSDAKSFVAWIHMSEVTSAW